MAVNSRDLVELEKNLRGQVHPELIRQMIKLTQDMHALRQQVMTLAGLLDRMLDNQLVISNATEQLQHLNPHLQRMRAAGQEVARDPSVTGEIDEK